MTRIFVTLASLNALALLASFGLGLAQMPEGEAPTAAQMVERGVHANGHFVFGLATVVFTLFVHSLIFTYFLGTGRWVKEVARAYQLADEALPRQTREFKRTVFPPALFSMLSAIATAASGGAAQFNDWPWWVHPVLAIAAILINAWAFTVEYRTVAANGRVLDHVMEEVHRRRRRLPGG